MEVVGLVLMLATPPLIIVFFLVKIRRDIKREGRMRKYYKGAGRREGFKLQVRKAPSEPEPLWPEISEIKKDDVELPPLFPEKPVYQCPTESQIAQTNRELWGESIGYGR